MAKKKSSSGDFNMAAEIRNILEADASLSSGQVYAKLTENFPNQEVNRNSCNVAFSHARRKLGIRPKSRQEVRRRRPGTPSVARTPSSVVSDISLLKAARAFIAEAGSADAAITAIQNVEALQLS